VKFLPVVAEEMLG